MKSYTDLEQSNKLAEILPLESADMEYLRLKETNATVGSVPFVKDDSEVENSAYDGIYERIPCWSLAALFDVLERDALFKTPQGWTCQTYIGLKTETTNYYDNPIDACYELISKLNKLNLL